MAKRHFNFADLKGVEGYLKPGGTLGRHHCTVSQKVDGIVVHGSEKGRVFLKPGDTLGYNCGDVWKVPSPESYRDPIRRFLAQCKIAQALLEYSDDTVFYSGGSQPLPFGSVADVGTGERIVVLGHDFSEVVSEEEIPGGDREEPGSRWTKKMEGGSAVLVMSIIRPGGPCRSRPQKISRLVVRKETSKEEVVEWLKKELANGL